LIRGKTIESIEGGNHVLSLHLLEREEPVREDPEVAHRDHQAHHHAPGAGQEVGAEIEVEEEIVEQAVWTETVLIVTVVVEVEWIDSVVVGPLDSSEATTVPTEGPVDHSHLEDAIDPMVQATAGSEIASVVVSPVQGLDPEAEVHAQHPNQDPGHGQNPLTEEVEEGRRIVEESEIVVDLPAKIRARTSPVLHPHRVLILLHLRTAEHHPQLLLTLLQRLRLVKFGSGS